MPDALLSAAAALLGVLLALVSGLGCGALRRTRGVDTAYTRKLFHLIIFSVATAVYAGLGPWATYAYSAGVVAVVLGATLQGAGSTIYEALARERDAPHRTAYVITPLVATAAGGLLCVALAGDLAHVGFLVTGWGDAVGEPAGRRWGRHPYRAPSLLGPTGVRTLEGSAAVALASFGAAWVALATAPAAPGAALSGALAIGVATPLVEAVSPRGLDNLTTMVAAAAIAAALAG